MNDDDKPDDSYERLKRAVMANPIAREAYEEAKTAHAADMATRATAKIQKKGKKATRRDG